MKKCSYCGRDNADESANCHECGTEFNQKIADSETDKETNQDEAKLLTIRLFGNYDEAGLAAAKLEAHGIKSWVNADDCGGWYSNLTAAVGVRLKVLAEDAEVAIAVLDAKTTPEEDKKIEVEAVLATPPKTTPKIKLAPGQMILGVIVGIIICLLYQWSEKVGTQTYNYKTVTGKDYQAYEYRNGRLIKMIKDRNLDGIADEWAFYKKDQAERVEYDENFDGKPDVFVTYSNDLPTTTEADSDFNGIPDVFSSYQNGIVKQLDYRPNGLKYTTTREIFERGVLVEIWRGGDSNGNYIEKVRYDPFFNPISTNTPAP